MPGPGLLDPVKDLLTSLTGLALVGSLLKPLPPLVGSVQDAVNGIGLLPFGLRLDAQSTLLDPALCSVNYTSPAYADIAFEPFNATLAGVYRYRQQQSVNLGGWFVNEGWMTPSLFACAANNRSSELDLASGFGSVDKARQALEQHWDTFIDPEVDFAYLASLGVNSVRLPIGAWTLGPDYLAGTAFEPVALVYNNSWIRVKHAIAKAATHGLGVIIDLHGATASQNGLPHSGFGDGKQALFSDPAQVAATQKVLTALATQLAAVSNVIGIELLNEPANVPELESFYESTITMMRAASPEAASLPLYVSDAFNMTRMAPFVGNRTDFVVLDHHAYFVYNPAAQSGNTSAHGLPATSTAVRMSDDRTPTSQAAIDMLSQSANMTHRNIVVGEFSCALSNSSLSAQSEPLDARRRYCQAQADTYANLTAGWSFWSYKLESCEPGWCFRSAVGTALPSHFSLWDNGTDVPSEMDSSRAGAAFGQISMLAQKPDADILADKNSTQSPAAQRLAAVPSASSMSATSTTMAPTASSNFASTSASSVSSYSAYPSASSSAEGTIPMNMMATADDVDGNSDDAPEVDASDMDVTDPALGKRHRGMHHSRYSSRYRARVHPRDFMAIAKRADLTADEQAIVKAYGDGYETAKQFALMNGSKLGFASQWVTDTVAANDASGTLSAEYAQLYREWFHRGLEDAEQEIAAILAGGMA